LLVISNNPNGSAAYHFHSLIITITRGHLLMRSRKQAENDCVLREREKLSNGNSWYYVYVPCTGQRWSGVCTSTTSRRQLYALVWTPPHFRGMVLARQARKRNRLARRRDARRTRRPQPPKRTEAYASLLWKYHATRSNIALRYWSFRLINSN